MPSSRGRRRARVRALVGAALAVSLTAALGAYRVSEMRTSDMPSGGARPAGARAAKQPAVEPGLRSVAERSAQRRWIAHFAFPKQLRALERLAMWERLAQCETSGDWRDGGEYGGGLGIYVGTWRAYGGHDFAARPQDATKHEQIIVAERIALDGMGGWGCAHRLGLTG